MRHSANLVLLTMGLNMKRGICAALAAVSCFGPAYAQNKMPSTAPATIETTAAAEMIALFTKVGFTAVEKPVDDPTDRAVEVRTPEGLVWYIILRGCNTSGRCGVVQPFIQFDGAGVTLNQANQFNLNSARLATLMLMDADTILLGCKLYLAGGVARANLETELGVFLADIASLGESVLPGAKATVSFRPTGRDAGFRLLDSDDFGIAHAVVNALGKHAPQLPPDAAYRLMSGADR